MQLMRVILDLIIRPRNFLNAFNLIRTMVKIKKTIPNNSLRVEFKSDPNVISQDLSVLLSRHGSDKSTTHNYDEFYFKYLRNIRNSKGLVVEIGIGTNNPTIPSSMGVSGIPGASLRAFRDFLPNMRILGADIDREILFSEERIDTYYVDQKRVQSFDSLLSQIKVQGSGGLDFVVIDGLHQPLTDLNSVRALLPYLKIGAKLFVEDIIPTPTNRLVWKLAESIFNPKYYASTLHITKSANLIEIERLL
jgi:hypothetical protein